MPYLTGIAGSGTGQYFTDETGAPYLVRWDTIWALVANAGNSGGATTWQTDIDGYVTARSSEGFNGLMFSPVVTSAAGVGTFLNGNTWDGVAPFSSPGVLNDPFWQRVDYLLAAALSAGMTVCMNVMFTYSLSTSGACLFGWTNPQYGNYGTAVGARYASQPNVIWEFGDDYFDQYNAAFSAFLTGLRGAGANQLVSVENESEGTSRYSDDGANTYTWGGANAQFNWCYGYNASYLAVENAYKEAAAHSVPSLPVVKMDGWYDNEDSNAALTETVSLYGRKWLWWVLSSGSRGAMFGNGDIHRWPVDTLASGLVGPSPGAGYVQPAALDTVWDTFASFSGWHRLVPDTSNALVTAGRGTRATALAPATPQGGMYTGGNTYVSASKTADGTLAVIYIPSNVTISVNGALMVAGYGAKWIDPASGASTTATIASTYNNPAANSAGDHDWVLLLATPPYATWAVP